MDAFIKHLAEALNQPEDAVRPEHRLVDLPNWDSLAILTTLSMLDMQYGCTLSGAELQSCTTVADLYAKVKQARPELP